MTKDGKIFTFPQSEFAKVKQALGGGYKNWDPPTPEKTKPATKDELTPPPSPTEPGQSGNEGKDPENKKPSTPAEAEGEGKDPEEKSPAAPGSPDGNGEPSVPHLDDPSKKTPYNPDDDPDISDKNRI